MAWTTGYARSGRRASAASSSTWRRSPSRSRSIHGAWCLGLRVAARPRPAAARGTDDRAPGQDRSRKPAVPSDTRRRRHVTADSAHRLRGDRRRGGFDGVAMSPALGGVLGVALRRGRSRSASRAAPTRRPPCRRRHSVTGNASRDNAAIPGRITSELFAAAILPCVQLRRVLACVVGQIGREKTQPAVLTRMSRRDHLGSGRRSPGRRGAAGGHPRPSRARSDILADPRPRSLDVAGPAYWRAPLVSTSLGVDAVVHF